MRHIITLLLFGLFFSACLDNNPNLDEEGNDILANQEIMIDDSVLVFKDTVYVPIYSEIYSETKQIRFQLTATLSIRNTSLTDTVYINDIDYYDTDGNFVRHYVKNTLWLSPMQSIEYVIDENDTVGGSGANFIINWGAKHKNVFPLFQGVMISTNGQQGISFLTDGISIKEK